MESIFPWITSRTVSLMLTRKLRNCPAFEYSSARLCVKKRLAFAFPLGWRTSKSKAGIKVRRSHWNHDTGGKMNSGVAEVWLLSSFFSLHLMDAFDSICWSNQDNKKLVYCLSILITLFFDSIVKPKSDSIVAGRKAWIWTFLAVTSCQTFLSELLRVGLVLLTMCLARHLWTSEGPFCRFFRMVLQKLTFLYDL